MIRWCAAVALVLAAAGPVRADVVEPAYVGPMGNPETVAMRPYKWMWRGVKALAWQTKTEFRRGNLQFPVLGTAQTARGIRKGSIELIESAYRGSIFQAVPPKQSHKVLGAANGFIQSDPLLRNASDFIVSIPVLPVPVFPAQKVVDWYPVVSDSELAEMEAAAAEIRNYRERREAELQAQREIEAYGRVQPEWKRAQRQYLGDRYVENQGEEGTGNLLRLGTMAVQPDGVVAPPALTRPDVDMISPVQDIETIEME
ncbi:MAG: hypothetical protein IT368_18825 [Candidatus Hydrogenedentes bacterium]|nr:hypothetical protein [Candidatus Hydrogenedentota bacterium]